jgi:hypothetical protein
MRLLILLILGGSTLLFMAMRHHAKLRRFDGVASEAGAMECFSFAAFLCTASGELVS